MTIVVDSYINQAPRSAVMQISGDAIDHVIRKQDSMDRNNEDLSLLVLS